MKRNLHALPSYTLAGWLLLGGFGLMGCERAPSTPPAPEPANTPAEAAEAVSDNPLARGEAHYRQYCEQCHGEQSQGDGRLADLLKVAPPNLTLLAARHQGQFPADYVYRMIDGREELQSHGLREMPVWGNIWTDTDGSPEREAEIRQQISELVEYLRTIQDTTQVVDGGA
jgi:mono/diheme cytochrome c family protein